MSTTNVRGYNTDTYVSLTNDDGVMTESAEEIAVCQILVQSAYNKDPIDISGGFYYSPANNTKWTVSNTSQNVINTSAISNYPNGTVTEYSVISTKLLTTDVSTNEYTTNISSDDCSNNTYIFQSTNTSSSYYDSNYVFEQSLIADCSDNQTGTYINANFDVDASNAKIQYAMQSRWNTVLGPYTNGLSTVGEDPTAATQDVSFNSDEAFAELGTGATDASYISYWYSVNSNGTLTSTEIDASYQPIANNFLVTERDLSGVTLNVDDDVGIFRIQQPTQLIETKLSLNDSSFNIITDPQLNKIPLFDGNGQSPLVYDSSKNALHIPGNMTDLQFKTLLNSDVYNTVADGWTYSIDISSNGGGYNILVSHPLISDLDDSNILDNPYYMENYVSNNHTITFSNATVNVITSTNGDPSVANSISVNLGAGEKLGQSDAGVNGQIILKTNTPSTRYTQLSSQTSSNIIPYVYYPTDANPASLSISGAQTTYQYFKGLWQKVVQDTSTAPSSTYLKSSNDAIMTLYAEPAGIVDDLYEASDFDFSFNNTVLNQTDVNLWRINIFNNIILNPQSFYSDDTYTTVEEGIATAGIITNLTDSLNYNGYRIKFTAKVKEMIGLYGAVVATSGWSLDYTNGSDTYLTSSSTQAYSENGLPIYDTDIIDYINSGNNLPFTYEYKTKQEANRAGGLVDYVDITYEYNATPYTITIPQTEITRIYDGLSTHVHYEIVSDLSYSFTGGYLNKANWELVYVTANSKYDATFLPSFGTFNNIKLTVNDIHQTDNYYAVRNRNNGQLAPQTVLHYVSAPTITNLLEIFESISPSLGNSLTLNGIFTANDLKPFKSITQGQNTDNTWTDLGTLKCTDVYYGLENVDNLTPSGSVITTIEYTPFSNSVNSSINVDLTNQYYYVPFTYDQSENSYTLESFNANTSNIGLGTKTNMGSIGFGSNSDYLTVANGYSSVNVWDTNQYNLTVSHPSTETTNFTVKNLSNAVVFSIDVLNNTLFLGTTYVSYSPNDYYRTQRLLGLNEVTPTFLEEFITMNYQGGQAPLGSSILKGISVGTNNSAILTSGNMVLGDSQNFRVLGDYVTINEISTTSPPTSANELGIASYNGGSLEFQYEALPYYSASFTFPTYRGYYSSPNDQYYTINRGSTIVNFNVAGAGSLSNLQDTLTSNMYYNETFIVDNLQNTSNELVANLNISGYFNYSIRPNGSSLTYPVVVTGDTINVMITNPNYTGTATNIPVSPDATPVVDPKFYSDSMTLKNYGQNDMYTFSGNWYQTGRLMAIRPSRVKLNNTDFPYNNIVYRIQLVSRVTPVYKAINFGSDISFNWLGNPSIHGSQDPDEDPDPADWVLHSTYTDSELANGINIGRKVVYQNPELPTGYRIVYIVSAPPYYKFEQISTDNCPVIPYNYDVSYNLNRTYRYMPYINKDTGVLENTFNPFQPITTYTDISGNTFNVVSDPEILNNVEFTFLNPPSITAAVKTPNSTRYGIIVPGTNLKVSLYVGLYNSTNSGNHTNPIWNAPITSIPSTPNINTNALIFRGRSDSGAISFSALQYPADIGYSSGEAGYIEVLHTDNSSNWYNIDFNVGNSAWFNDNIPVTYFNANAHGIRPTFYTVIDINDPLTQRNKRRVYKYTTDTTIDIDAISGAGNGIQTFNITFNSRSHADFDIPMSPVFPTNISDCWNYTDLLDNTVINNSTITWTPDTEYTQNAFIGWSFGNTESSKQLLTNIFAVRDEEKKFTYVHLYPFMRYMNQFYMQVGSISWDGSVIAPMVLTRSINLVQQIPEPLMQNDTYAIQEYSEQGMST